MGEGIFGKPWFKSLTAWGVVLFVGTEAATEAACASNMLTPEVCASIQVFVAKLSAVMVALGLRKAVA